MIVKVHGCGDKIASLELVPVISIAQGLGGQREGLLPRQQLKIKSNL